MDQTPEDRYREELKKQLTEKHESETPTYYTKTGFRKPAFHEQKKAPFVWMPPRRRLGLALMLPILLILMMSHNLRGVVFPLLIAVALYMLIKRRR